MSDDTTIRLRIWETATDGYYLMLHPPGEVDAFEAKLPVSRETLKSRLQTIRDSLNRITRSLKTVKLTEEERDYILHTFAQEGYDAFADWAGASGQAFDFMNWVITEFHNATTINITAKSLSLPWEIMSIDAKAESLWGLSYVIQRQLPRNGVPVTPRTQRIETYTPPKVGLLALDDPGFPAIVEEEIPFFIELSENGDIQYTLMDPLDPAADRDEELTKLREFGALERHIYHFACHVELAPNPARSALVITKWFRVSPDDIRRKHIDFKKSPLVVLNACDTAKSNPFHTSDLISNLLRTDIQGIVAAECQLPDCFAAAFMKQFYRRLLDGAEIGLALKEARCHFLRDYNNPLGLLYSLYQISPRWRIVRRLLPA